MNALLSFEPMQYVGFAVVLARISGLMTIAPLLGDRAIPNQIKVAFAFMLSLVFFPFLVKPELPANPGLLQLATLVGSEFALGYALGYLSRLFLAALSLAGEVVGMLMGLSVASMFDPSTQSQVSLLGQMHIVFALLLFLSLDGHHMLIQGLAESYRHIPPGTFLFQGEEALFFVRQVGEVFKGAIQVGAPLIVSLLAANFGMGLLNRAVPQINVIVVGFPFTILVGLVLFLFSLPFFFEILGGWQGSILKVWQGVFTLSSP